MTSETSVVQSIGTLQRSISSFNAALTVAHRELLSLFISPMAYVILFVFLLVNGATYRFYIIALRGEMEPVLASQFGGIPFWFLWLLVPALVTMRTFAEERRTGTFELLVTSGISDFSVVLGKFLAAWIFVSLLWAAVLVLLLVSSIYGSLDWGIVGSLYFGLAVSSLLLTAMGVLASSFTQNQLIAAILAVSANLGLFFFHYLRVLIPPGSIEHRFFEYVSPLYHFGSDFSRGVIDLRTSILYVTLSGALLFGAVKVLERRRWT